MIQIIKLNNWHSKCIYFIPGVCFKYFTAWPKKTPDFAKKPNRCNKITSLM